MARFGLVGLGLVGLILAAGCSTSSPTPIQARCMTGCMRANTVCSRTTDCGALCGGSSAVPARCDSLVETQQACAAALTDATLCMLGMPGGPCDAETQAVLTCATGSGADAGM